MQIYLVGGAVRDELLNYPVYDKDWVVVGATPEEMIKNGYRPVGSDFPVFIHPKTGEEYALARTERKSGKGYSGFQYHASPDVTLEEDLSRRDLTINAMAKSSSGELIDPYGGQNDLATKQLRHVSPAFSEDPLRVLRVARFAARYAHLGFTVAAPTLKLMQAITSTDELSHLTKERIWQEMERALSERSPLTFFNVLEQANALEQLFPPFTTLVNNDKAQQIAAQFTDTTETKVRFAALCYVCFHTLSEAQTKLDQFCRDLRTQNQTRELAIHTLIAHPQLQCWSSLSAENKLALIKQLDLLRRPERLPPLQASTRLLSDKNTNAGELLANLCEELKGINPKALMNDGYKGAALGEEIAKRQIAICELF